MAEARLSSARYLVSMGKPRGQESCSCFPCHLNTYEALTILPAGTASLVLLPYSGAAADSNR